MRVGTRASALALAQARLVAAAVPGSEIVEIRTAGDEGGPLGPGDDKSRFVREIDSALLAGEVDIAVHSAKDVPGELAEGIEIAAVPRRLDPRDAWIGRGGSLDDAATGTRVGTSSVRRRSQLLAARPDLEIAPIRGNIDTRLRRCAEGDYDALVLARAGLERLGWVDEASFVLEAEQMTPAPGQGALAICTRIGDSEPLTALAALDDAESHTCLLAERAAVVGLSATCDTPIGIWARIEGDDIELRGYAGLADGSEWIRDRCEGNADEPAAAGAELAERMLAAGAEQILAEASR